MTDELNCFLSEVQLNMLLVQKPFLQLIISAHLMCDYAFFTSMENNRILTDTIHSGQDCALLKTSGVGT